MVQSQELTPSPNRPEVRVKIAMTLDGKIATATGESKWITGPEARSYAMGLRRECDAILVGIGTVLADNPSLTVRDDGTEAQPEPRRRIILDTHAKAPADSRILSDALAEWTTIIIGPEASAEKVDLFKKTGARVWRAPLRDGQLNLSWVLGRLDDDGVSKLLVEGGGEVNASFFSAGMADRIAFFYAPKILGGTNAKKGVGGFGARDWSEILGLVSVTWAEIGPDLLLTADVARKNDLSGE